MNKYVVKANLFFYFMTTSYYIKSRNNVYIISFFLSQCLISFINISHFLTLNYNQLKCTEKSSLSNSINILRIPYIVLH